MFQVLLIPRPQAFIKVFSITWKAGTSSPFGGRKEITSPGIIRIKHPGWIFSPRTQVPLEDKSRIISTGSPAEPYCTWNSACLFETCWAFKMMSFWVALPHIKGAPVAQTSTDGGTHVPLPCRIRKKTTSPFDLFCLGTGGPDGGFEWYTWGLLCSGKGGRCRCRSGGGLSGGLCLFCLSSCSSRSGCFTSSSSAWFSSLSRSFWICVHKKAEGFLLCRRSMPINFCCAAGGNRLMARQDLASMPLSLRNPSTASIKCWLNSSSTFLFLMGTMGSSSNLSGSLSRFGGSGGIGGAGGSTAPLGASGRACTPTTGAPSGSDTPGMGGGAIGTVGMDGMDGIDTIGPTGGPKVPDQAMPTRDTKCRDGFRPPWPISWSWANTESWSSAGSWCKASRPPSSMLCRRRKVSTTSLFGASLHQEPFSWPWGIAGTAPMAGMGGRPEPADALETFDSFTARIRDMRYALGLRQRP